VIYGVARSRLNYFESSSFSPESGEGKGREGRSQLRIAATTNYREAQELGPRSLGSLRFILANASAFRYVSLVRDLARQPTSGLARSAAVNRATCEFSNGISDFRAARG